MMLNYDLRVKHYPSKKNILRLYGEGVFLKDILPNNMFLHKVEPYYLADALDFCVCG